MHVSWTLAIVAALAAGGCYRRHTGGERAVDAGRADAAAPIGRDGASPGGRDAAVDAEVPLPIEPVDDPGPGGRPSDDPAAQTWGDPPDLDPDDPCCEPDGAPIDIPFADAPWGIPAIEWNGDGWGVLYPREDAAFQELARDGARVGAVRRLGPTGATGEDLGFEWAGGRFFTILPTAEPGVNLVGLLDRRGVLAGRWVSRGNLVSVAFVDREARWLALRSERGPDGPGAAVVVELDDRLEEVGSETLASGTVRHRPRPGPVVGLKSRAVAFIGGPPDEAGAHPLLVFAIGVPVPGSITTVGVISLENDASWTRATRLRDRAVFVQGPDGDRRGAVVLVDPFEGTSELRPWPARTPSVWGTELFWGAVGVDTHDVVATCSNYTSTPDGPGHGALLRLFGADGAPLGAPVIVAANVSGFSVGSDGGRVLVAWPRSADGVVRVQAYRLRGL